MSGLRALWTVSLVISAAALLIMIGLVVARMAASGRRRGREVERRRLIPILLEGGAPVASAAGSGNRLLTDLSVELIRLVRGSDRERFAETASELGVPDRLRHRLRSGSPRVRLAAIEALAEFRDERSIEHLRAALRDRSADVRLSAALALATLRRAPPVRELVVLLGIGTTEHSLLINSLFREIAATDPDDIKALIEADDLPAAARIAAINALAVSGDYSLIPLLVRLAEGAAADDPALPAYLRALGGFGHPAASGAIEHGLVSTSANARAAACEAAGRIALLGLTGALADRLDDEDFDVRLRAGEALIRLGEAGLGRLREVAAGGVGRAHGAAAGILAERGLQ